MTTFLAIDWGTTNRRVYHIGNGEVIATHRDNQGVKTLSSDDYNRLITADRARFGDYPVLIAGMAGSTIGWRDVPYVAAPASLSDLAQGTYEVADRVAIVPGVSYHDDHRSDVMRGEEVQLLGAVADRTVKPDSLLCQPGTHCKWAIISDGKIAKFTTSMTGELFALLRTDSVLSAFLTADVTPGAAFKRGLAEGAKGDLAASLFSIRAASVLGHMPSHDAASFCSGVLLGSDVAARLSDHGDEVITILADAPLRELYRTAIETLGGTAAVVDSQQAFVAGITAIKDLWK
ncbi:2-dehydro-3-deoxygalactonokinase [Altericroceibacterium indicum]|nr:2-dehydro-3-deoxygalactonokinase [Altericroceibacterium indicum]